MHLLKTKITSFTSPEMSNTQNNESLDSPTNTSFSTATSSFTSPEMSNTQNNESLDSPTNTSFSTATSQTTSTVSAQEMILVLSTLAQHTVMLSQIAKNTIIPLNNTTPQPSKFFPLNISNIIKFEADMLIPEVKTSVVSHNIKAF
jgi:hypothetical protein